MIEVEQMSNHDIEWLAVKPGSVMIGDARGALMHSGSNPQHEVCIEFGFEISSKPITFGQWKKITGSTIAGYESDATLNRLSPLMVEGGLVGSGDLRPPSEAEWSLAEKQGVACKFDVAVELLADRPPKSGYWGAPCDGRPWVAQPKAGGAPIPAAHVTRVWQGRDGVRGTARGTTPREVTRPQMGFRLVRLSEQAYSTSEPPRMPGPAPTSSLLVREAIIALIIGIIPSFTWAWFNASPGYIFDSWLNLVVGGLFVSALSAFVWRPRSKIWRLNEDNRMQTE